MCFGEIWLWMYLLFFSEDEGNVKELDRVRILHKRTAMHYGVYKRRRKGPNDEESVRQYATLVGQACSERMLLFRSWSVHSEGVLWNFYCTIAEVYARASFVSICLLTIETHYIFLHVLRNSLNWHIWNWYTTIWYFTQGSDFLFFFSLFNSFLAWYEVC